MRRHKIVFLFSCVFRYGNLAWSALEYGGVGDFERSCCYRRTEMEKATGETTPLFRMADDHDFCVLFLDVVHGTEFWECDGIFSPALSFSLFC